MPIKLKSCKKKYTYDQDKVCHPQETLNRVFSILRNSNLKILKNYFRRPLNFNIPVYTFVAGDDFLQYLRKNRTKHNDSVTGKGVTDIQAQASGLMELIERFSYVAYTYNNKYKYKYTDIKDLTPDFELFIPLLSNVNDQKDIIEELKNLEINWAPAYNLTKDKDTFVPEIYKYIIGSNGLAAGNTIEEAILQAMCEIIERHVFTYIILNKVEIPTIRIDSIEDKIAQNLIEQYKSINMKLILKDFSLDLGIPTIGVIGYYENDPLKLRYVSAGTHTSPLKALYRALTELPQTICKLEQTYMGKNLNSKNLDKFLKQGVVFTGLMADHETVFMEKSSHLIDFEQIPNYSQEDIKDEIYTCIDFFNKKNIEILIIDKTYPKLNIPVVICCTLNSLLITVNTTVPYYYQAIIQERRNNFINALNYLDKVEKFVSDWDGFYNYKGNIYCALYDQTKDKTYLNLAIDTFRECLKVSIFPNFEVQITLINLLLEENRKLEAKNLYNVSIQKDPMFDGYFLEKFPLIYSRLMLS